MSTIQIPGAPLLWVRWDCRRCGHTGGVARTTVPLVDRTWTEAMMRHLLDGLRRKLVRIHQKQGCIATIEDFHIYRGAPDDKVLQGEL